MTVEAKLVFLLSLTTLCEAVEESRLLLGNEVTFGTVIASVGVLITICVLLLLMCTDCYNSEVDSTNHPACRGTKGGTGGNYYPTNTASVNDQVLQSSYQTNEYVTPSSYNAPLPYTMIPTQVPEESGFQGYETAPVTNIRGVAGYGAPSGGLSGYGGTQNTAPARGGRNVNPMEPEEPPPPYGAAVHGYR